MLLYSLDATETVSPPVPFVKDECGDSMWDEVLAQFDLNP